MAPPKDDIRTFYFRAVELGYHLSVFELVSIDGPLPANPRIGEREVMNTMLNMVSNGNRIVIDPIPESLKAELLAKELRGK
jgi:hypothetical protein